jgi:hypothetical protein
MIFTRIDLSCSGRDGQIIRRNKQKIIHAVMLKR